MLLKESFGKGIFLTFFLCIFININKASANNLSINNVALKERDHSANTIIVEFDISWNNSWRIKINHDAGWLTVRLNDPTVNPTNRKLCTLIASGLNPSGTVLGSSSNSTLEIYVPSDKTGAFLRRADFGGPGSVASSKIQLKVNYSSAGFGSNDVVNASVFGIEMVYIP